MMKGEIIEKCKAELQDKKRNILREIDAVKDSMNSDTKSSAGDKYETGREMMNQERDKLQMQLAVISQQLGSLKQISASKQFNQVDFGAVVKTSMAVYFISISYGKLPFNNRDVFLISPITPLAKMMIGKKTGDTVKWNDKELLIKDIS